MRRDGWAREAAVAVVALLCGSVTMSACSADSSSSPSSEGSSPAASASATGTEPPAAAPGAAESRSVVASFFGALDAGDAAAAASLLCTGLQTELGETLNDLTDYTWEVPRVESESVEGGNRVLVVAVESSDGQESSTQRLRITVAKTLKTEICGFADA